MAELAKLNETITHLEQIVNDDELSNRLYDALAADGQFRHRAEEALRRAQIRLQGLGRIAECYADTGIELSTVRIGHQYGIWDHLVKEAPAAVEADALAASAAVDANFLLRFLRYAAAVEMVKQIDRTKFRANRRTEQLVAQGIKDATLISHGVLAPMALAFPSYFESIDGAEPKDPNHTAWHSSVGNGKGFFEWLAARPVYADAFNRHMTFLQKTSPRWLDNFPLEKYVDVHKTDDQRVQFCDVAGGNGQQTFNVVQKYPSLQGRAVVQDRPDMKFTQNEGVEFIVFDLFNPNPTKGARVYHLRQILHDWPDAKCLEILSHLKAVMEPDSVILINDAVIHDVETRDYPTSFDMSMAMLLSAKERTANEWNELFKEAGLKRISLVEYDPRGMAIQVLAAQ